MADPRREGPDTNTTVEIEKTDIINAQLKQIITSLGSHRAEVTDSFRTLTANIELVSNDLGIVKDRVTILESAKHDADLRQNRVSAGVKSLSSTNAEQDAQLAQERAAREALALELAETKKTVEKIEVKTDVQTMMLVKVTSILDTPLVKKIGIAAGLLLLGLLTTATGYLARGNVQPSQPTIIQVAPPQPPVSR